MGRVEPSSGLCQTKPLEQRLPDNHLDHHNCLEVLVVRGPAADIRRMADRLIGAKGVKHGKLTITTTGKDLPF